MSQITTNTTIQNFTDSSVFTEQLQTIQNQLEPILDDFQQAFVNYNMNKNNSEYQQTYYNITANLDTINNSFNSLSTSVKTNMDNLNNSLIEINEQISLEKKNNIQLKTKLGLVENKNNAADEMISNYEQMYKYNYLANWGLSLSIIGVLIAISKVFPGKPNM